MRLIHPLIISLFCAASALAQTEEKKIDAIIGDKLKPDQPGMVVLAVKDNKVIYRKAFGMANLEHKVPMTSGMVFEIGSITKQFTAAAILMLYEQKKLGLDDDITKFIPDYPVHGHKITIQHLLTHTSGIKSYTSMEDFSKVWRKDYKPVEFLDFFKNQPMDFAPGEKWSYNNSGYFLLGVIIEKISGIPYAQFIEDNIFKPLGMSSSYFGSQSKIIPFRASGYQGDATKGFVNAEYLSLTIPYAAGSLMSNVDDLLKWNQALWSNKVLKKETLDKATTAYLLNNGKSTRYGFGFGLDEISGSKTIEHSGGIFGYLTNGIYLPQENVLVLALANCNCLTPQELSTLIAASMIGKPHSNPAMINVDEATLKSYAGKYITEEGPFNVTVENGQLSYSGGGPANKIYPYADRKFFKKDSFVTIEFTSDAGAIAGLTYKDRGMTVEARKVKE